MRVRNNFAQGNQAVAHTAIAAPLQPCPRPASQAGLAAKPRVAVGSTHPGVRFERSDRAAAAVRVRGRGQHQSISSSQFKAHPAPGSRKDHERAKALAANALDAVGQPQTRSTPSGQLHKLTKQEGSLGE